MNEELKLCNLHLNIPTSEAYSSLNLAMAVQIVAYELRMLLVAEENGTLHKPAGGTTQDLQLRILGHALLQTFERYYITVAVLAKNGSGKLSRSELERLCILTAQRISQLNEFAAPEFYDRNQIRQFITLLRETGVLTATEDDKLEFNSVIQQISEDSRYILSQEIRHNIIRVAPQVLAEEEP